MLGRHRPATPVLLSLALASLLAGRADGQAVEGRVYDALTNRPVADAVVRLVDDAGEGRATLVTDSTGRYRLSVPGPGTYRLQAERLGYEPFDGESLELGAEPETLVVDAPMQPSPVPIRGVEVPTDRVNRRLRDFFGMSPAQLRLRPIRSSTILDQARRGGTLSELVRAHNIPNLQILPTRSGPCYQFRGRGCLPVYLDGARQSTVRDSELPLEMLGTVVVVLPNEMVAYPAGAVHLFTTGFTR